LTHMPILVMRALLTSLLGLNERLRVYNFYAEFKKILEKSSFLAFGKFARPKSTKASFPRCYNPAVVTFLQKLICKEFKS